MTKSKEYNSELKMLVKKHRARLMARDHNANKGTYGKLLIIAGSKGMAGAAFLSGLAAYRMGTGMVKYFGTEDNRIILQTLLPEAMYESWECDKNPEYIDIDKLKKCLYWADYVIIGPGLSKSREAKEIIRLIFKTEITERLQEKKLVILDADALNIIAEEGLDLSLLNRFEDDEEKKAAVSNIVITPHAAEMERLIKAERPASFTDISAIKKSPEKAAGLYGRLHGVNVILKDAETVVYISNGKVLSINSGCGAMAKAGSGDVLCGFIAGTAAVLKGDILDALPIAVYLHGTAGCIAAKEKGEHGILARDIAEAAGKAIAKTYQS